VTLRVFPPPRHTPRRWVGWLGLLGALLALTTAFLAMTATPALAHAELLSTNPPAGADIATAPKNIQLFFNEGVRPVPGGLRLLGQDANPVTISAPRGTGNGFEVSIPALEPGAYIFGWRVVSEDGHPLRGAFTFRVGNVGDQSIAASLGSSLLGGAERDKFTTIAYNITRVFRLLATLLATGLVAFFLSLRGWVFAVRRFRFLALGTGAVGLTAEVANILLFGPFVSGRTISGVTDGVLLDDTLRDPVGRVGIIRVAAFAVMLLLRFRRPSGRKAVHVFLSLGLAFVLVASQLFPGHATVGRWALASTVLSVIHVAAAGVWLGALFVLGFALLRSERLDRIRASQSFSSWATGSLVVLLATGVFATARQVGSLAALTTTAFGRVLIAKLVLIALTVLLGLRNRRRLPVMGERLNASVADFRRSILRESWLSLAIVLAATVLSSIEPARLALRAPVSATIETESLLVDMTVEPAGAKGTHEIHLYTLEPNGLPKPIVDITAFASLPEKGIDRLPLTLVRAGSNHFQVLKADLAVPGNWRFEVTVNVDDFSEVVGSTRLKVP
jgi:copper transport protein